MLDGARAAIPLRDPRLGPPWCPAGRNRRHRRGRAVRPDHAHPGRAQRKADGGHHPESHRTGRGARRARCSPNGSPRRLEGAAAKDRAEKWRQCAIEAIKQCGRALASRSGGTAHPGGAAGRGRVLRSGPGWLPARRWPPSPRLLSRIRGATPASTAIGRRVDRPRGGLQRGRIEADSRHRARPIDLGPLVLRSETAALCTLAVITYELRAP